MSIGRLLVTVGYMGLSPWAPGTCGSLPVGVLFVLLAGQVKGGVLGGVLGVTAVVFAVVTVLCGPKFITTEHKDPSMIVSDEAAGQAVTYLPWVYWAGAGGQVWPFALYGFVLFRIFDIIKPPPVRQLEKLRGAWGVLADDLAAGVYAGLVLWVVMWLCKGGFWPR